MATDLPILRTSERSAFHRCWWQWYMAYRMGYTPRFVQADAAWFGIGVHEAMAQWYLKGKRRGRHPAEFFEEWVGDEIGFAKTWLDDNFDEAVWEDAKELGVAMLEGYVLQYGKDPQWSFISTEQPFAITITDGGKPVGIFKSRWDGVFRDLADGRIKLLETKTAAAINTAYLENDDQAGAYFAVASHVLRANKVLKPGEDIEAIEYNFLRKAMPDERPRDEAGQYHNKPVKEHYVDALRSVGARTVEQSSPKSGPIPVEKASLKDLEVAARFASLTVLGEVSKSQPPALFHREPIRRLATEQATQLQRLADEIGVMNLIREGKLPLLKSKTRDCPRCPFWGPCILDERGSDSVHDVLAHNFIQRDPYEDERKPA